MLYFNPIPLLCVYILNIQWSTNLICKLNIIFFVQVYVPEQDAAWELEGDQFEDLLERHGRCDAETCICPKGRHEDVDYTVWEIVSTVYSIRPVKSLLYSRINGYSILVAL